MTERLEAKFTTSTKGGDVLIDPHSYEYNKDKEVGNKTFWRCRDKRTKKCPATATTVKVENTAYIEQIRNEHNHSSQLLKKRVKFMM